MCVWGGGGGAGEGGGRNHLVQTYFIDQYKRTGHGKLRRKFSPK